MCKVSVVIPYYNRENTLIRALESVKNQTFSDFEIILVDDGSTDNSYNIVEEFISNNKDLKITHLCQENSGPSKARNFGISKSRGKYIAFLDSDDSWEKDKLKIQVDFMEKNDKVYILGTDYNVILPDNKIIKSDESNSYQCADFYKMFYKNFFCLPTVIVRRDILKQKEFLFDENKKQAEDQLFYLRIIREHEGGKIKTPLVNLYKMEFGQGGLSGNLEQLFKNEQDNFKKMYLDNRRGDKKLHLHIYLSARTFSFVRHIRRSLISKIIFKNK